MFTSWASGLNSYPHFLIWIVDYYNVLVHSFQHKITIFSLVLEEDTKWRETDFEVDQKMFNLIYL